MSKKASADQFSLSGGNSDSVGHEKPILAAGRTFFLGGSSYEELSKKKIFSSFFYCKVQRSVESALGVLAVA